MGSPFQELFNIIIRFNNQFRRDPCQEGIWKQAKERVEAICCGKLNVTVEYVDL